MAQRWQHHNVGIGATQRFPHLVEGFMRAVYNLVEYAGHLETGHLGEVAHAPFHLPYPVIGDVAEHPHVAESTGTGDMGFSGHGISPVKMRPRSLSSDGHMKRDQVDGRIAV
ncbi:hypothetical protein [Streptomyces sp. V3I8]|uniref:hypothetical protein n=1 Tax=Streptomyces sp. V3I8 TaxID=3042279 RepID=UPI0027D81921|nr:hypothetical protein [Streptomyces sp. V3I8]